MDRITVVLDGRQMKAGYSSGAVKIEKPGARPKTVPLSMVERVIVTGDTMISSRLLREITAQGIPAVFLPARGKGSPCFAGAGLSANVEKRILQYRVALDKEASLAVAKDLVVQKIEAQQSFIREYAKEQDKIHSGLESLKNKAETARNLNSLLGHEGAGSRIYYQGLAGVIPAKWKFSGRNRRPPKDPVNSLLSLGYTMAEAEVAACVHSRGPDPTIGFLHAPRYGRNAFCLDILEPVRPLVDGFCLALLEHSLSLKEFTLSKEEGCRLNKKGRDIFFRTWAKANRKEGGSLCIQCIAAVVTDGILGKMAGMQEDNILEYLKEEQVYAQGQ